MHDADCAASFRSITRKLSVDDVQHPMPIRIVESVSVADSNASWDRSILTRGEHTHENGATRCDFTKLASLILPVPIKATLTDHALPQRDISSRDEDRAAELFHISAYAAPCRYPAKCSVASRCCWGEGRRGWVWRRRRRRLRLVAPLVVVLVGQRASSDQRDVAQLEDRPPGHDKKPAQVLTVNVSSIGTAREQVD